MNLAAAKKATLTYPPHLQTIAPKAAAGDRTANLVFLAEALKAQSTGKHTSTREMSDTGSWSELDPKLATPELGREDVDRFVDASVKFIESWKTMRPSGTK